MCGIIKAVEMCCRCAAEQCICSSWTRKGKILWLKKGLKENVKCKNMSASGVSTLAMWVGGEHLSDAHCTTCSHAERARLSRLTSFRASFSSSTAPSHSAESEPVGRKRTTPGNTGAFCLQHFFGTGTAGPTTPRITGRLSTAAARLEVTTLLLLFKHWARINITA